MARVIIDSQRCKGCCLCVNVCPKKSLQMAGSLNAKGVMPVVSKAGGECIGCRLCATMCPDCCIEIEKD